MQEQRGGGSPRMDNNTRRSLAAGEMRQRAGAMAWGSTGLLATARACGANVGWGGGRCQGDSGRALAAPPVGAPHLGQPPPRDPLPGNAGEACGESRADSPRNRMQKKRQQKVRLGWSVEGEGGWAKSRSVQRVLPPRHPKMLRFSSNVSYVRYFKLSEALPVLRWAWRHCCVAPAVTSRRPHAPYRPRAVVSLSWRRPSPPPYLISMAWGGVYSHHGAGEGGGIGCATPTRARHRPWLPPPQEMAKESWAAAWGRRVTSVGRPPTAVHSALGRVWSCWCRHVEAQRR